MSTKYVVLGYLSWRPMTGYEIKKLIAESETLHWSANDNQIYAALVEMHRDGWLTKTAGAEEVASNRQVYVITDAGAEALQAWVVSDPLPPQTKNSFHHQLMWADSLHAAEMDALLDAYLNAVGEKLFFIRVQADQKPNMPQRSAREQYVWDMIQRNWIAHYEIELDWIRKMRQDLAQMKSVRQRV